MNDRGQYGRSLIAPRTNERGQYGHTSSVPAVGGFWSELFEPVSFPGKEELVRRVEEERARRVDEALSRYTVKPPSSEVPAPPTVPPTGSPAVRVDQVRVEKIEKSNVGLYVALGMGAVAAVTATAVFATRRMEAA